jgi:hypothetical protein
VPIGGVDLGDGRAHDPCQVEERYARRDREACEPQGEARGSPHRRRPRSTTTSPTSKPCVSVTTTKREGAPSRETASRVDRPQVFAKKTWGSWRVEKDQRMGRWSRSGESCWRSVSRSTDAIEPLLCVIAIVTVVGPVRRKSGPRGVGSFKVRVDQRGEGEVRISEVSA